MRRKERSRSPDRGDTKRCCLQTETTKPDILSTIADHVLAKKKKCLEDEQQSDIYVPPLGKETLYAPDSSAFPLLPTVMDFLIGKRQVMLLMGDAGSGKTYFLRQLERDLWAKCNGSDDPIPILFSLSAIDKVDSDLLGQVLKNKGLDKHQIQHLKNNNRQIILLCDSYDESQVQRNIYNCNKFNTPEQGCVKLIIACRSSKIGWNSDGRFRPEPTDKYDLTDLDLFQKVAMAPFTYRQIEDYIIKYVGHHHQLAARQVPGDIQSATQQPQPETPPPPEIIRVWSVLEYMETLADTPNLMELVENPFILSVVLKLLSSIFRSALDAVRPPIPLDALYQHIFECWIEVSKRRLYSRRMTEDENLAFDALTESGFADLCMAYMKSRVVEIFKHPKKASSTRGILNGAAEWSARCFVTDTRESLLLESVPLNRSKATCHFIRPSLLEYIYSLVVFCPNDLSKGDTITGGFTTNDSDSDNSEETPEVTSSTFVNGGAFDKGHPLSFINIADLSTLVQLLADRAQKCQSFREWLIERVRESSNSDGKVQKLAANAMTILVTAGMQFNSADLRGIKIKGANLTGGKFDLADLRDADLTGTTLAGCWMRQANLQGTQLRKARFGELPPVELNGVPTTFARPLDGRFYAVGFANGSITVFDAASWIPIHTHQESKESITALAFSPKSDLLSFSFGHKIGLLKTWNHTNNKMSESFGEHDGSIN
ncbi:Transducin (beta)-like 1 X-linked receptor 1, partial [Linnemannia gamsii]